MGLVGRASEVVWQACVNADEGGAGSGERRERRERGWRIAPRERSGWAHSGCGEQEPNRSCTACAHGMHMRRHARVYRCTRGVCQLQSQDAAGLGAGAE